MAPAPGRKGHPPAQGLKGAPKGHTGQRARADGMRPGCGILVVVRRALILLVLPVVLLVRAPSGVGAAPAEAQPGGRVIVGFADAATTARAVRNPAAHDARPVGPRALALEATPSEISTLKRLPGVAYVEPDHVVRATALPDDPCISGLGCAGTPQWYLQHIGAPVAWNESRGAGVTIAVLDTGVDATHPELSGKVVGQIDVTQDGGGPGDHGTRVAGVAAAATNNASGVAGVAWDASVLSVKVLDQTGFGLDSWVADGIWRAIQNPAVRVINMSLSGEDESATVSQAVAEARRRGVIVVAAAGNCSFQEELVSECSRSVPDFPAAFPGVISVAASTQSEVLADFSDRWSGIDVSAPGVGIVAPVPGGGYGTATGTSLAAPMVAGVAALLHTGNPSAAEQRIRDAAVPLVDRSIPRLDVPLRPYGGFVGGVFVTQGDLGGDGDDDVVTGAGPSGGPHVRVFHATTAAPGAAFFAYPTGFTGGVDVAVGDVDPSHPGSEIITGAGPGGGPHVRVFAGNGAPLGGFFAYPLGFTGGVHVAAGNVDGTPGDEIVTGAGRGGGPHVRVFAGNGAPLGGFFAYPLGFTGGVDVASGPLDGSPGDEIVTGAGPGGGPHVRVLRLDGSGLSSFFPYPPAFPGGVEVAAGNVDSILGEEIITGAGPGGGPHMRVLRLDGAEVTSRFSESLSFAGGLDVAGGPRVVRAATLRNNGLVRRLPVP